MANGVVYSPGGDGTLQVYSAATGALQWKGTIPSGGPLSTPATANGFVYIGQASPPAGETAKL